MTPKEIDRQLDHIVTIWLTHGREQVVKELHILVVQIVVAVLDEIRVSLTPAQKKKLVKEFRTEPK